MNWFKGLAGLAIVKGLGTLMMRWMSGRGGPTNFDPGSGYPPEGQQYWPPPGQHQYPGAPPPQYPYPPQHQQPQQQQQELPMGDDGDSSDDGPPSEGSPESQNPQQPAETGQAPPSYPQQPYYYPPPGYQQQPAPRKRKRRKGCLIFTLFLAVVVLVGVWIGLPLARNAYEDLRDRAMSALGLETTQQEATGSFPVDDPALPTQDPGVSVRDNQLTFTVAGHECGSRVSGRTATGQFCLVQVAVENTGAEPRHFVMDSQWMIDSDGHRYPGVEWVSGQTLPELLVPGQSLNGQIVFDVPSGATVVYAQLHESPFSPGVLIDLR